jgi:hypothetical protein
MPEVEAKPPSRWQRVLNPQAIIALSIAIALLTFSHMATKEFVHYRSIAHEVGFALLVAVIIWGSFELFEQAKSDEEWNQRIEKIARNVFFGVFKRNFPEEFIKEANILVLDHAFIRSGLNVTYTIVDDAYTDRAGQSQRFVKLYAIARYKVKNVGNTKASLPIGINLPNPLIDEMKPSCEVFGDYFKICWPRCKGGPERS